jgi:hypothetical protein
MNRKYKILIIVAIVILAFILAAVNLFNTSILEITANGGGSGELTYTVTNQTTSETITETTTNTAFKKRVSRGTYEIIVTQENTSFYQLATTKPLLQSAKIDAQMEKESSRIFVGDNPGPCSYYYKEVLFSSACDATYNTLSVHTPATPASPSTTDVSTEDTFSLAVNGLAEYRGNLKILLSSEEQHEGDSVSAPRIYDLSTTPTLANGVDLKGMAEDPNLAIKEYRDGFVVYNKDLKTVRFFSDPSSDSKDILPPEVSKTDLEPNELSISGNVLALSFTDNEILEKKSDDPPEPESAEASSAPKFISGGKSEIFLTENGNNRHIKLGNSYEKIVLCNNNSICALNGQTLTIFRIDGNKARESYRLPKVEEFTAHNGQVLLLKKEGVVRFDPATGKGKLDYSTGGYTLCGIQGVNKGDYLACLIDLNGFRRSILVQSAAQNEDSIDKKILELSLKTDVIENISIYRNIIYVSPKLGERTYQSTTNTFGYSKDKRAAADAALRKAVQEAGIDTAKYRVVNPLP